MDALVRIAIQRLRLSLIDLLDELDPLEKSLSHFNLVLDLLIFTKEHIDNCLAVLSSDHVGMILELLEAFRHHSLPM